MSKVTKAQYEKALKNYSEANTAADTLMKKRNAALLPIQSRMQTVEAQYKGELDKERKKIEDAAAVIEAYCTANKGVMFSDKVRGTSTAYGLVLSFRKSTPKVIVPDEEDKGKLALLIEKVKKAFPTCVREVTELNKQAIAERFKDAKDKKKFEKMGFEVKAEETFLIKVA